MMNKCWVCGIYHYSICPLVEEIEYFQDGTIKRIKYNNQLDIDPASAIREDKKSTSDGR